MSCLNEGDVYMNATEFIRHMTTRIDQHQVRNLPKPEELDVMDHMLDLLIGDQRPISKYNTAQRFLNKHN
jgi:hypothetical protein